MIESLPGTDLELTRFAPDSEDFFFVQNHSRMAIGIAEASQRGRFIVLKAGTDAASRRELALESTRLEALGHVLQGSSWLQYLPRRVLSRGDGTLPFVVDESASRLTALDLIARDGPRQDLVNSALNVINELKKLTATVKLADGSFVDDTILRRVGFLRDHWGELFRWRGDNSHLDRLKVGMTTSLLGRRVEVGWQHGDFSPGNILVQSDPPYIVGVIDWGGSGPNEFVGVDSSLLALSAHSLFTSTDLNSVVERIVTVLAGLDQSSEDEDLLIERLNGAWPSTQDLSLMQGVILTWVYYVVHRFKIRSPNVLAPGHWVQHDASRALRAIVDFGLPTLIEAQSK